MDDRNDPDALMGIGAFARRVGLAPSALRFYDDCDVLRPARVDEVTGYRYYAPGQETRAVTVRRLREAGLPLTEASAVLDGPREEARAVLEAHARKAREAADSARSVIEDILGGLPGENGTPRAVVRLGGAELASAVRQVAPAAAGAAAREEFPVLGHVLLECEHHEVRLVATDRYRLAVRALRPADFRGVACHALLNVRGLSALASWAVRQPELSVEIGEKEVLLHGDGSTRQLRSAAGPFPDYRLMLDNLPAARHRVIADRTALVAALVEAAGEGPGESAPAAAGSAATTGGPVSLRTDQRQLWVDGGALSVALPTAICTGPPVTLAFDPAVLLPALDAGVGPDVLLEISAPHRPVVVRSADQGSFTTLVMPVRQDAPAER
ncbi:MerR family transcriptional regulator [Streptomyces sp. NPDC058657]|uniref:DNA polymerase III subunit beta family protein n=1 Tax=unclassified Streptomyces TaxID=2593676 RepID=UPI00366169CC